MTFHTENSENGSFRFHMYIVINNALTGKHNAFNLDGNLPQSWQGKELSS